VSGADGSEGLGRALLRALHDEPLDVHQLAADVGVITVAVTAELNTLIDAGLVHAMRVRGEADLGPHGQGPNAADR
jgi:predicted transcriptional regulator